VYVVNVSWTRNRGRVIMKEKKGNLFPSAQTVTGLCIMET